MESLRRDDNPEQPSAEQPANDVDVIVVGSGAAGSLYAAKLSAAGKSVLLMEAGPGRTPKEMISSQIWARRLKWGGAPVLAEGDTPLSFNYTNGWGFGGSAVHHFAVWPRLHPDDFQTQSDYGHGNDWPFGYDTLRPYYDRIQEEVGVSGDAEQEIWRPAGEPYPMGPIKTFKHGELIRGGFEKLDKTVSPVPLAINSEIYKGRAPCFYDGWCDAGCPIGALANPFATYLVTASKAKTQFMVNAVAKRVLVDPDSGRATGVEYVNRNTGETETKRAAVVILAAGSVQNVRVLLNSRSDHAPDGLGNHSDLLGRYLACHSIGAVFGLFPEETESHMGVNGGQLMNQDGYVKTAEDKPYGSYTWVIGAAVKPNDLLGIANSRPDLFGERLDAFMHRAVKHIAHLGSVGETIPQPDNRIVLAEKTDEYGIPLAKTIHNLHPESHALWTHAMTEGREVMQAAGAEEVWQSPMATTHFIGGTIMGEDPEQSVTDGYGRIHGTPNLVVAGGSLFPSGGGVNPTFTIHALALRSVEHVLDNWSDYSSSD